MESTFYGNTWAQWLTAAGVLVLTLAVLRGIVWLVARRVSTIAEQTATGLDDLIVHVLSRTHVLFRFLIAVFAASLVLSLPAQLETVITRVAVIALLVQGGLWCSAGLRFWVRRYRERQLETDAASVTTMSALSFTGRLVLWTLVLLLILDNLGVEVTALVTGLGIGGIAVALALQNVLGDLFASLSIVLDKPFVIGDFLIVDDFLGSVEHIGLKTTRIRSLSGEQVVFSNGDLLNSRIRNYGRMFERRVVFRVGVTYQTSRGELERIPGMIREAVEKQDPVRFDRAHWREYGDSALLFECVYYVLKPEFNVYMDIQQAINLEIHRRFEEAGIEFAYPTRTVYWKSVEVAGAPEPMTTTG